MRRFLPLFSRLTKTVIAVFLLSALTACADENKATLITASGPEVFNIEIANTSEERAQGLMFRQSLADDAGMLFDFGEEREVAFWMSNTFIPLDMIFIAADGEIKSIHENARPQDPTSIPSGFPVRFVLEIPGGRSREIGLVVGDRLEHPLVESR